MSPHRFSRYFPFIFLGADLASLIGSLIFFKLFIQNKYAIADVSWKIYAVLILTWLTIFYIVKLYEVQREQVLVRHYVKLALSLFVFSNVALGVWFATNQGSGVLLSIGTYLLGFAALLYSWRTVWFIAIRWYRSLGYNYRTVMIVGKNDSTIRLANYITQTKFLGYRLIGFLDDIAGVKGGTEDLESVVREKTVDILFCYSPSISNLRMKEILDFAENNLIKVKLLTSFSDVPDRKYVVQNYGGIATFNVTAIPLDSLFNRIVKRSFDILVSSLVLVFVLSWLVPLIGILIKLDSPGPIFFKQPRNGRNNKLFNIFKFRSMKVHEDHEVKQATQGDSRVTKLGSFLRKSSIDELPQFINVFLGEMSVVGPRPHAQQHNDHFKEQVDKFLQRHSVKPGITGLAQAKGYRGEMLSHSDLNGRVKLDRFYVRNWSLILDVEILFWTIDSILFSNEKAY